MSTLTAHYRLSPSRPKGRSKREIVSEKCSILRVTKKTSVPLSFPAFISSTSSCWIACQIIRLLLSRIKRSGQTRGDALGSNQETVSIATQHHCWSWQWPSWAVAEMLAPITRKMHPPWVSFRYCETDKSDGDNGWWFQWCVAEWFLLYNWPLLTIYQFASAWSSLFTDLVKVWWRVAFQAFPLWLSGNTPD